MVFSFSYIKLITFETIVSKKISGRNGIKELFYPGKDKNDSANKLFPGTADKE